MNPSINEEQNPLEPNTPIVPAVNELGVRDTTREADPDLKTEEERIFAQGLKILNRAGVLYVVGGAFARHAYTGIWRTTKDLDVMLPPSELRKAMDALEAHGFHTLVDTPHWLAKAKKEPHFIDLIFGTGNGMLRFERDWFEGAPEVEILGVPVRIMPIEEIIAMASYVAVRHRFDSADVAHLIRCTKGQVDWQRVLDLLGEHRMLLLWNLILFNVVYPGHSDYLPQALMVELFEELRASWKEKPENEKAFRGSILDPFSFSVDVEDWGYEDRRDLTPLVNERGELL